MTNASARASNGGSFGWALGCCLAAVALGWTEAHTASGMLPVDAYLDAAALFGLPLAAAALLLFSASNHGANATTSARARYGGSRRRETLTSAAAASLVFASMVAPLVTLGLLGVPQEVSALELWITLEVTWLGALALYGVGLLVRVWAGRLGLLLLLVAEWASALPTASPLPLLPTSHVGHLLAVGPELTTSAGASFVLLIVTALASVTLAAARVRP